MTGQSRVLRMSLACLHGHVMIHIGVCAALQVAALACTIRGHVRHVQ